MNHPTGRAASGFRLKLQVRAKNSSRESLDIRSGKSGHESRQGRAASGFSPKLQILANSLSLESLDIKSGKSGHESRQGSRQIRIQTQTADLRQQLESGKSAH